jgi:hypothetical protein
MARRSCVCRALLGPAALRTPVGDLLSALEAYPKLAGSSPRLAGDHRAPQGHRPAPAARPETAAGGDLPEVLATDAVGRRVIADDDLRAALTPCRPSSAEPHHRYLADLSCAEVGELLEFSAGAARSAADGTPARRRFSKGART